MAIPLSSSAPAYVDPYGELLTGDSSFFTAGVGSWVSGGGAAACTRDTTSLFAFGGLTASLKFVTTATGQYCEVPVSALGTGVFKAGVEYQALVAVCIEQSNPTPASVSPEFALGLYATDKNVYTGSFSSAYYYGAGKYEVALVRWVPTADRSGVALRIKRVGGETGTMTWHVGIAKVLRVHPGSMGLGAIWDPSVGPATVAGGPSALADEVLAPRPYSGGAWRRTAHTTGYDGDFVGLGEFRNPDSSLGPGYMSAGALNGTASRRGTTVGSDGYGINFRAGMDSVGVQMGERSSDEVEIYPDLGDYDVVLLDGSTDADTKHWVHEEADGAYDGGFGRQSRVGLYFQKDFHVLGAQTTGTAKNEPDDYWQFPFTAQIDEVRIHLGTAPTGSTFIVDVNVTGTSIFTTTGNRPTIAIAGTDATSGAPDITLFPKDARLSIDVDTIGSTIAGSDLTVMVRGRYLW